MSRRTIHGPLFLLLMCLSAAGHAQTVPAQTEAPRAALDDESPWRLGVGLGYGERDNPLALSEDLKMLVDLDIAWFGDRWFFDNGDGGFMLRDAEHYTLNLIGRFNSDRVFFAKTDSDIFIVNLVGDPIEQIVVPDRDYAVELGLELLTDGDWGSLQAAVHRDAGGTHDGYELYLNYARSYRWQRWSFQPSMGLSYKSARLNDYYWGVRADEASFVFPEYRAGAGANKHARFAASYRLDRSWSIFAVAEFERLSSQAARSPLVEQRDLRGVFVGFHYGL